MSWTQVDNIQNQGSQTITGLQNGTEYSVTLRATNQMGSVESYTLNIIPEGELIQILTDDLMGIGTIQGIVQFNNTTRIYYNAREDYDLYNDREQYGDRKQFFIETDDLQTFTSPQEITVNNAPEGSSLTTIKVVYHNNNWYAMGWGSGDDVNLYTTSDGITFNYHSSPIQTRTDGGHSFFFNPQTSKWIWTGRVRSQNDEQNSRPDRWDYNDPNSGRRGISKYETDDFYNGSWTGGLWVDPMDLFNYEAGVNPAPDADQEVGPNFYSGLVGFWDEDQQKVRGFTTYYIHDPQRGAVERQDEEGRNTRWTGPMYSIQTTIDSNGDFVIESLESPFPIEVHKRTSDFPAPSDPSHYEASDPNAFEVGQIYTHHGIYEINGNKYIFYFLRDDTHYERRGDFQHETSIYAVKIN